LNNQGIELDEARRQADLCKDVLAPGVEIGQGYKSLVRQGKWITQHDFSGGTLFERT